MAECSENRPRKDFLDWLNTGMNAIQMSVGLITVLGAGASVRSMAMRQKWYPEARCVVPLWQQLQSVGGDLKRPTVHFSLNPYKELVPDKSLILQGRNKEGKTSLLRTSIPFYRWWSFGGYYGIYLDGAQGKGVNSFEKWQTTQMFGSTVNGGSEIGKALKQYRDQQRIRCWLHDYLGLTHPKPAIVIVDQFEELLKRFPEALDWANTLTNLHVRDNLARVVFVVNSNAGAKTLLNLNQGVRFKHLIMTPVTSAEAAACGVEKTWFEKCKQNIGLYKQARMTVEFEKLDTFVEQTLTDWSDDFHLPFPLKYDRSWRRLPEAKVTEMFLKELRKTLERGTALHNEERVDEGMRVAEHIFAGTSLPDLLDTPQLVFQKRFESRGAPRDLAEQLAKSTRRILGNPAPEVPPNGGK
eukprot:CAMPEP_0206470888 /NCGR_PEP_ID=MMETSP0324_2-20121206/31218_1 /ASSEMBLY_ACC=CAM_ASM_000836 /TAXON_ID=2866 /ORGANISM="Crypthecodinium cohnii, Strain Seligo" /LENGTH=411 /DNA_ID=CAMNT_0053945073 /DNA_START=1 /DNA_END=1236 /DNA_ORIENTATION=+